MSPSGNPLASNVSREAPREASRRGERRRCGRIPLGLPVRVHFAGRVLAVTVELVNAGRGGCYLRGVTARVGAKVAFGFALRTSGSYRLAFALLAIPALVSFVLLLPPRSRKE